LSGRCIVGRDDVLVDLLDDPCGIAETSRDYLDRDTGLKRRCRE
jgi:hypothetical protein